MNYLNVIFFGLNSYFAYGSYKAGHKVFATISGLAAVLCLYSLVV